MELLWALSSSLIARLALSDNRKRNASLFHKLSSSPFWSSALIKIFRLNIIRRKGGIHPFTRKVHVCYCILANSHQLMHSRQGAWGCVSCLHLSYIFMLYMFIHVKCFANIIIPLYIKCRPNRKERKNAAALQGLKKAPASGPRWPMIICSIMWWVNRSWEAAWQLVQILQVGAHLSVMVKRK